MGSNGKKKQKDGMKSGKSRGGDGGRGGREREQPKAITDERFAAAQSDPRFMEAPKKKSKVEIDSRFQRMFTDRSFASSKSNIDKRGKRKNGDADSSLGHYYRLQQKRKRVEEDEDEDEDEEDVIESVSESDKSIASIEEEDGDDSASTSTADSDVESSDDDDFMKQEENIPEIEEETRRLAVVNLDWLHVRAVDLYMLLGSFLPKGGRIVSVAVYPTEFGLQRMEEEVHGPVGVYDVESEQDNADGEENIDNKKLRAYELSKLRYYYAVVECDSIATADYLYQACDGVEFERSSNKLDLRFIPDSMEFKHQPRDVANEAPANYEGLDFQTQALQQSNIQLTWDEDEPTRTKTLKNMLQSEQPAESEYNDILASDESDTDEDDNADGMEDKLAKKRKRIDQYRALSKSGDGSDDDNEEDNDQDMEVTFHSGLRDISKHILEKMDKKSETVWEANLRKGKEKKKARKSKYSSDDESSGNDQELGEQPDDFFLEEPSDNQVKSNKKGGNSRQEIAEVTEASRAELELLVADDKGVDNNLKGFNLKPKKRKGKKVKEADAPDEEKIPTFDYSDPRFSAIIDDPRFALDPTDPQYRRSAAYVRQVAKKQKTGDKENVSQAAHLVDPVQASEMHEDETDKSDKLAKRKQNLELSLLVRSIKMNSRQAPLPSQAKVHHKHRKVQK